MQKVEFINLINNEGKRIGKIEKIEAHKTGKLHEAFSIFIFNKDNKILLQKRADGKYHSAGLWTNTCCSHARYGEEIKDAIHRRLFEEMGFDCELTLAFSFSYNVKLINGLAENELDYVFVGRYDEEINFNEEEVSNIKWVDYNSLLKDIKLNPGKYTEWLKIILYKENILDYVK